MVTPSWVYKSQLFLKFVPVEQLFHIRCGYTGHFPWGKWLLPTGKQLFVSDFPRVKLPEGIFHGYVKKNKRIPMAVPEVTSIGNKNTKWLNQSIIHS